MKSLEKNDTSLIILVDFGRFSSDFYRFRTRRYPATRNSAGRFRSPRALLPPARRALRAGPGRGGRSAYDVGTPPRVCARRLGCASRGAVGAKLLLMEHLLKLLRQHGAPLGSCAPLQTLYIEGCSCLRCPWRQVKRHVPYL